MATKRLRLFAVGATLVILITSCLSCGLLSGWLDVPIRYYHQQVTLEEATGLMGVTIPVPTYLPDSYAIQEVYVYTMITSIGTKYGAILLISDKPIEKKPITRTDRLGTHQEQEARCRLQMDVEWYPAETPDGKVLSQGKRVSVNDSPGVIIPDETDKTLVWAWKPDPDQPGSYQFQLEAPKSFRNGEMVKIAESARY